MSWAEDLVQAVLAQLRADPVLAPAVFDGDVTGSPQAYVVLTASDGDRVSTRLTSPQSSANTLFGIRSIGLTRMQAHSRSGRVKDQLIGFTPVVAGRRFWRMRHDSAQQAMPDDTDPTQRVWFASDLFLIHSDPA